MLSITRKTPQNTATIGYRLRKLTFALDRKADQLLQDEFDLTFSQFLLLFGSAHSPQAAQCTVARFLNLTQAAISRQIEGLVSKGFLTRVENSQNRREYVVELTPAGTDTLARSQAAIEQMYDEVFSGISSSDSRAFSRVIDSLLGSVCTNQITTKASNEKGTL